jgi:3-oxoacyl-[acyl-carrier-protein] synthase-3
MFDTDPAVRSAATEGVRPTYLSGAAYRLGDTLRQAESLAGLGAFFEENGLPPDPAMLGLGAFHVAEGPLWALAADAARAALGAVGRIDALILCSSRFPGETADHAEGMRGLLAETGIEPSFVAGVTLNRCASFLTGIRLAASLVATGQAESCLVVTADRFTGDAERLRPFALFSDGAAACVIGAAPGDGPAYRVAGAGCAVDRDSMSETARIAPGMVQRANRALETVSGLSVAEHCAVLPTNVYTPIAVMAEAQGGAPATRHL